MTPLVTGAGGKGTRASQSRDVDGNGVEALGAVVVVGVSGGTVVVALGTCAKGSGSDQLRYFKDQRIS